MFSEKAAVIGSNWNSLIFKFNSLIFKFKLIILSSQASTLPATSELFVTQCLAYKCNSALHGSASHWAHFKCTIPRSYDNCYRPLKALMVAWANSILIIYFLYNCLIPHLCSFQTPAFQTNVGGVPTSVCLEFNYHMFGQDIGSLIVFLERLGESQPIITYTGNLGDAWNQARLTIESFVSGDRVRLG